MNPVSFTMASKYLSQAKLLSLANIACLLTFLLVFVSKDNILSLVIAFQAGKGA